MEALKLKYRVIDDLLHKDDIYLYRYIKTFIDIKNELLNLWEFFFECYDNNTYKILKEFISDNCIDLTTEYANNVNIQFKFEVYVKFEVGAGSTKLIDMMRLNPFIPWVADIFIRSCIINDKVKHITKYSIYTSLSPEPDKPSCRDLVRKIYNESNDFLSNHILTTQIIHMDLNVPSRSDMLKRIADSL